MPSLVIDSIVASIVPQGNAPTQIKHAERVSPSHVHQERSPSGETNLQAPLCSEAP